MGTWPQQRPQPSVARSERYRKQKRMIDQATKEVLHEVEQERLKSVLDNRPPPAVSPPSGRVVRVRRRYPPIRGGAVIGRREGYGTA